MGRFAVVTALLLLCAAGAFGEGFDHFYNLEYDEALEAHRKAVELGPDASSSWNNLGGLLMHKKRIDEAIPALEQAVKIDDTHRQAAAALGNGSRRAVWLGALACRHSRYADLCALAGELARLTGATLGLLAEGGNAAGAWLAGAVPHRAAAGAATFNAGAIVMDVALSSSNVPPLATTTVPVDGMALPV